MFDRRESIRKPHGSTCQWIFDRPEYREWLNEPCALLWIKGDPGSGKSTLMSHVFKSLRLAKAADPGALHLSHFFSARGHELEHTPAGMLRYLLNQIFVKVPEARPPIRDFYLDKKRSFGLQTAVPPWQQQELEDLCHDAILTCSQFLETVILVDALDEAGEQSARSIAKYFHAIHRQVKSQSGWLRLCLSCRHYPVPANIGGLEIAVELNNGNDVKKFIRDSFESLSKDEEGRRQIDALVQKAAGNFQWADLIVPLVEKLWLDGAKWNDITRWIREIPKQLTDVYTHIIQNVIDERHRLSSFLLLMSVCIAERPLTVGEISDLIEHGPSAWKRPGPQQIQLSEVANDVESLKVRVRTLSGGLARTRFGSYEPRRVHIENYEYEIFCGDDRILVELTHETVRDYLISGGLAMLERLSKSHIAFLPAIQSFNEQQSLKSRYHAVFHRICLRYLINIRPRVFAEESPVRVDRATTIISPLDFIVEIDETRLPLLEYAIIYVVMHATKSTPIAFLDPQEHLNLLQDVRAMWIQILEQESREGDSGLFSCQLHGILLDKAIDGYIRNLQMSRSR